MIGKDLEASKYSDQLYLPVILQAQLISNHESRPVLLTLQITSARAQMDCNEIMELEQAISMMQARNTSEQNMKLAESCF